jgi:hypothetical protein
MPKFLTIPYLDGSNAAPEKQIAASTAPGAVEVTNLAYAR